MSQEVYLINSGAVENNVDSVPSVSWEKEKHQKQTWQGKKIGANYSPASMNRE